jgi:hypothetical protein
VRFRPVQTGQIASQFGALSGLTLKFVPIRAEADFASFPVHQLGFEVADMEAVLASVARHGGRIENAPERIEGRLHAAIRDPVRQHRRALPVAVIRDVIDAPAGPSQART